MQAISKKAVDFLIPFEKLQGLGNDFVFIHSSHLPETSQAASAADLKNNSELGFYGLAADALLREQALAKAICDRHYGVGADGLMIIAPVRESEEALFAWRFYNSDGSVGEMCGNGIRCAAKFIYENGLSSEETSFKIETLAGDISVELLEDELVQVGMGLAREIKEQEKLTLSVNDLEQHGLNTLQQGKLLDSFSEYTYVSMGNPHAVAFFNELNDADFQALTEAGPLIEKHHNFPNKTNVEFARIKTPEHIELKVWERACGFTNACGTGACATAIAAILKNYCQKDTDIVVSLPGGDLIIRWDTITEEIYMTGKAELSFSGQFIFKVEDSIH